MSNRIATTLHTILCNEDHQKTCLWYLEEQRAECWELEAHAKWLNKAEGIVQLSELDEEKVERLLRELISVINTIKSLQYRFYQLEEVINLILKETCLKVT